MSASLALQLPGVAQKASCEAVLRHLESTLTTRLQYYRLSFPQNTPRDHLEALLRCLRLIQGTDVGSIDGGGAAGGVASSEGLPRSRSHSQSGAHSSFAAFVSEVLREAVAERYASIANAEGGSAAEACGEVCARVRLPGDCAADCASV